jgi:hypothetical protein
MSARRLGGSIHAVDKGGFVGTIDYGGGDTWTDTATPGDELNPDDVTCPADLPFPFKITATITGGPRRLAGATGRLLIRTCNEVSGAATRSSCRRHSRSPARSATR